MAIVKIYRKPEGIYKTGCFQGTNQRWYGFIPKGKQVMDFITKKQFKFATEKKEPPPLLPLPF